VDFTWLISQEIFPKTVKTLIKQLFEIYHIKNYAGIPLVYKLC